jgi:hypothetical protein
MIICCKGRQGSYRDKGLVSMIVIRHLPGGTEENTKTAIRIVGISTENRIEHFPNTSQNHSRFSQLARQSFITLQIRHSQLKIIWSLVNIEGDMTSQQLYFHSYRFEIITSSLKFM